MIFLNAEVVCPQQYLPVIAKSERCERIAVDGGIENHSSIKIAIRRQICTTPGETKPQWCASTVNHCTRSHSEIQIQKGSGNKSFPTSAFDQSVQLLKRTEARRPFKRTS